MAELNSTDVLFEVLMRLPTSSRRRFRLVCRLWRNTVDTRTTEMRSRPGTLVSAARSVLLIEDPSSSDRSPPNIRKLWTRDAYGSIDLVGTCNGLVCLCDSRKPSGRITLSNPVTRETLALPPLPALLLSPGVTWDPYLSYSFAYHPITGRYKVVYVPYYLDRVWVFTLGEPRWRDVAIGRPHVTYDFYKGIHSIDGVAYWAVKGEEVKVMSFDLDNENVTSIRSLPNMMSIPDYWHLTVAHGRLGIAYFHESTMLYKTEVWVMEHDSMAGQLMWSRFYNVQMQTSQQLPRHYLARPTFTHGGEYVLTLRRHPGQEYALYEHKTRNDENNKNCRVVEIDQWNEGREVVADIRTVSLCRTFAYVETTEPLSVYRCW